QTPSLSGYCNPSFGHSSKSPDPSSRALHLRQQNTDPGMPDAPPLNSATPRCSLSIPESRRVTSDECYCVHSSLVTRHSSLVATSALPPAPESAPTPYPRSTPLSPPPA